MKDGAWGVFFFSTVASERGTKGCPVSRGSARREESVSSPPAVEGQAVCSPSGEPVYLGRKLSASGSLRRSPLLCSLRAWTPPHARRPRMDPVHTCDQIPGAHAREGRWGYPRRRLGGGRRKKERRPTRPRALSQPAPLHPTHSPPLSPLSPHRRSPTTSTRPPCTTSPP